MADWFIMRRDGQEHGPISAAELRELAADGRISENTRLRRDDRNDYVAAGTLPGLFDDGGGRGGGYSDPAPRTRKRPWGRKSMSAAGGLHAMLFVAAALLIAPMFLPWWGLSISKDNSAGSPFASRPDDSREDRLAKARLAREARSEAEKFHFKLMKKSIGHALREKYPGTSARDRDSVSLHVWGWKLGPAITGMIFGVILIVIAILPLAGRVMRPFKWIGFFLAAGFGIAIAIWSLVWWLGCPGKDFSDAFTSTSVGGSFGVYVAMAGGALAAIAGLIGGITGVIAFARRA